MATYNPQQLGIQAPSGGFQTGGWYEGRQFWGGTLSDPGQIHPSSNQQGAGGQAYVAPENENFIEQQRKIQASQITAPVNLNLPTQTSSGITSELESARALLEQNLSGRASANRQQLEQARRLEQETLKQAEPLTQPFREDLEETKRAEYGTEEVIGDQKALLDELDQLLTEGNNLIREQQQITGISAIRNPRIQQTMEDVAARAGVINAVVNLQNTYLANAYQSIDRSIANIQADRQDRLNYYNTVLSLADRDIVELTQESRRIAEEQTDLLRFDLNNAQESVNMIKQLMIDPSSALLMSQAGVTLNDSVEVINTKMSEAQYANEVRDASNSITSSGGIAVTNPSTVPVGQLKSFTDSKGQVHYFKIPKTASGNDIGSYNPPNQRGEEATTTPRTQGPQFSAPNGTMFTDPATGIRWISLGEKGWEKA